MLELIHSFWLHFSTLETVDMSIHVFWVLVASLFIYEVHGEEDIPNKPGHVKNELENISCGGDSFARDCWQCPFDKHGNYHGGFRCSGDCKWLNNECKQQGVNDITGVPKLDLFFFKLRVLILLLTQGSWSNIILIILFSGAECISVGGPDPGKHCLFPFKNKGTLYNGCTLEGKQPGDEKLWCSTLNDEYGNAKKWGNCGSNCKTHFELKDCYKINVMNVG